MNQTSSKLVKIAGFLILFLCLSGYTYGQSLTSNLRFQAYDSVSVELLPDEYPYPEAPASVNDNQKRLPHALLHTEDTKALLQLLKQKTAFGASQAVTPSYDLRLQFYRRGTVKDKVLVSLYTNNLFASFPLRNQRQGDCMCKGTGGYCCSQGGISKLLKAHLLQLLVKYHIDVSPDLLSEP